MPRRRKRIGSPNVVRQGRLAMINHVIRIVTDIVTTTESVTEIEKVIVGVREIRPATVTKTVTDRVKLRLQKKKKIRVKTKEAVTMWQKKQVNKDSDILAALLCNKIILFPCNLHAQFWGAYWKVVKTNSVYFKSNQKFYRKLHV